MVSASFKYSNFDIYCTESNVSIAPRAISDHFSFINQIAPSGAKSCTRCDAGALLRLREWHRIAASQQAENRNVCDAFNSLAASGHEETRRIHPAAFTQLGA
jgi:hypothetical protein